MPRHIYSFAILYNELDLFRLRILLKLSNDILNQEIFTLVSHQAKIMIDE